MPWWLAARLVLLLPFVGLLGHSSCAVATCAGDDCDDFDDDDDDDNDANTSLTRGGGLDAAAARSSGFAFPTNEAGALRLTVFRTIAATDPRSHPVRRLVDIEGISLFEPLGDGEVGEEDLRAFTERLLQDNFDLIGLPVRSGRLLFADARFLDSAILVSYVQETSSMFETPRLVPGARLLFEFDRLGRLVSIDNTTRIDPD